jgi:CheY-like chemotaxis protein
VDRVAHLTSAAEYCEKTAYDFLILDLGASSAEDIALGCALRVLADEHGPTPLVALVEPTPSNDPARFAELSPDAVFEKPVDLERVCQFCEGTLHPELAVGSARVRTRQESVVCVGTTTPADDDSVAFESERFVEATMGIESLQLSVLDSYLEDMPRRVESIGAAIRATNGTLSDQELLSARALARTIGAFGTARCLGSMGEHVRAGSFSEAEALLGRLQSEVERSLTVLRDVRTTLIEGMQRAA